MSHSRLIFLAESLRTPFPQVLESHIPFGSLINQIAKEGLLVASQKINAPYDLLKERFDEGNYSSASFQEWTSAISGTAIKVLTEKLSDKQITVDDFTDVYEVAYQFGNRSFTEPEIFTIQDELGEGSVPETTGAVILDKLYGGIIPNTLAIYAGGTGTGKTRHSLTTTIAMLKHGFTDQVLFFENELSKNNMQGALAHAKNAGLLTFPHDTFKVKVGDFTMKSLERDIRELRNPNAVIVVDSVDHLFGDGDDLRAKMGNYYQTMKALTRYVKFMISTSQLNRYQSPEPSINNLAESSFKGNITDYAIAFIRGEIDEFGVSTLQGSQKVMVAKDLKGRFGVVADTGKVNYVFDYKYLRFIDTSVSVDHLF